MHGLARGWQGGFDIGGWAAFLGPGSLIGVGLWRRWWVPGFWYAEMEAEVKRLRPQVLRLTRIIDQREARDRERNSRRTDDARTQRDA